MIEMLPPVSEKSHVLGACLCCPPKPVQADMEMVIAVGFGGAGVSADGKHIWDEQQAGDDWDKMWTVADAEKAALENPEADWRIYKFGPMWGGEWQRQGPANGYSLKLTRVSSNTITA